MAITLIQQPDDFTPAYNDIIWVVDSDNKGNCKFKYICDVYVDSVKVFRDKKYPDPQFGYGVFNLGRVLENYSANGLNIFQELKEQRSENYIQYYLEFGEEYDNSDDCSSVATIYDNLYSLSGNPKRILNIAEQYESFNDFDLARDYYFADYPTQFFTDNKTHSIAMNEKYFLNALSSESPYGFLKVRTYDSSNNPYGIYYFPFEFGSGFSVNSFGAGPVNINSSTYSICRLNPLSGAVINNDVYKYEVCLSYNADNEIPEAESTFATSSSWTSNSAMNDALMVYERIGLTYSGTNGTLKFVSNADGEATILSSTCSTGLTASALYEVGFNVVSASGGASVAIKIGNATSGWITSVGSHLVSLKSSSGGLLSVIAKHQNGVAGSIEIDNLYITKVYYNGYIKQYVPDPTEIITFNVDKCKPKHEPIRLIWLNSLGAYEQFTYKLKHETVTDISRKTYDKTLGRFLSSEKYGYKVGDRVRSNINVSAKSKTLANSNWLSESTANWLLLLYHSLDVYRIENIYYQESYDTQAFYVFEDGSYTLGLHLVFRKPHRFKTGDEVILIMDNFKYNTGYNGYHTILSIPNEYTVQLDMNFGNSSTLESGVLYLVPNENQQKLIPVNITSSQFPEQLYVNKKMFNNEIEFEPSHSKNIQRG